MQVFSLIVVALLIPLGLAGQTITPQLHFHGNQTLPQLRNAGVVSKEISYERQLLHLAITVSDTTHEYYFANDTTWLYRAYINNHLRLSGNLYPVVKESAPHDTIITFDPETYEEQVSVLIKYTFERTGEWQETAANGTTIFGNYESGKKNGLWGTHADKERTSYYRNDTLIGYRNIDSIRFNRLFPKLADTRFLWCLNARTVLAGTNEPLSLEWRMSTAPSEYFTERYGVFQFDPNGSFEFTPLQNTMFAPGVGQWAFLSNGDFELTFSDGQRRQFTISYAGLNNITLKRWY